MYVYLLRSLQHADQKYIGITKNLKNRLLKHNSGSTRHTAKFRPWRIEWAIWISEAEKAWKLEQYFKSHSGRAFIQKHF
jgi:predicted GIY-YIG superfamily endonuclease